MRPFPSSSLFHVEHLRLLAGAMDIATLARVETATRRLRANLFHVEHSGRSLSWIAKTRSASVGRFSLGGHLDR